MAIESVCACRHFPYSKTTGDIEFLLPDGRGLVFDWPSRNNWWAFLNANGNLSKVATREPRTYKKDLRITFDGRAAGFTINRSGESPVEVAFHLDSGLSDRLDSSWSVPVTEDKSLEFETAGGSQRAKLSGRSLNFDERAPRAFSPDRTSLVVAIDRFGWFDPNGASDLTRYDRDGNTIWRTTVPQISRLSISGSGKWIVAICRDRSLRWFRLADGQEVLAAFITADRHRWVAWTPAGYFDASADIAQTLGWVVERGEDALAEFIPVTQFRGALHRPDRIVGALD